VFYYCVSNLYDPLGTVVGFWWTDLRWTLKEGRKEGVAGGEIWRETGVTGRQGEERKELRPGEEQWISLHLLE
jgi:hypothetical protein